MNIKEKEKTKTSEAKIRAINKYSKMHYKSIACRIKIDEFSQINEFAENNNVTVSKMIYLCIQYCMNNNIDIINGSDDTNNITE